MCQSREGARRMSGTLHLAQALSNRARRGRKTDFRDAERLVKRLVSQELVLSFVPDAEQRLWRTLTRTRYQRTRDKGSSAEPTGGTAGRSPYQALIDDNLAINFYNARA